jgi:DNA-binding XRE family transcriptional regulator
MKLEQYMKIRNLTDGAFAAQVGVTTTTVLRWRRGDTCPDWDIIPAIIAATDGVVTANDFVPEKQR